MAEFMYCPVCATNLEPEKETWVQCNNCETWFTTLDPILGTEWAQIHVRTKPIQKDPEFIGAILYCPRCCGRVDVQEPGWLRLACECKLEFLVGVEPAKVAEFSMF